MAERIRNSVIPKKKWKNYCARQQEPQMVVLVTRKVSSILGAMVVAQQISKKERLLQEKCVGILRGCSHRDNDELIPGMVRRDKQGYVPPGDVTLSLLDYTCVSFRVTYCRNSFVKSRRN